MQTGKLAKFVALAILFIPIIFFYNIDSDNKIEVLLFKITAYTAIAIPSLLNEHTNLTLTSDVFNVSMPSFFLISTHYATRFNRIIVVSILIVSYISMFMISNVFQDTIISNYRSILPADAAAGEATRMGLLLLSAITTIKAGVASSIFTLIGTIGLVFPKEMGDRHR